MVGATDTLVDSYPTSNYSDNANLIGASDYNGYGQSFTPSADYTLTSVQFYLLKSGSPTGHATAKLYVHTGTYGTSSIPSTLLATSDSFDISTLTTSATLTSLTFTGAQQYSMVSGTKYCIVFMLTLDGTVDGTNYVTVPIDSTSPTHGGNGIAHYSTDWYAQNTKDAIFYVYGAGVVSDTTAPTYSSLSVSTMVNSMTCHFTATFNDETALHPNGKYQFGTNNTGSWVWDTAVNFTATPQTLVVSKVLNSTVGTKVSYQWNFTDNAGNSNNTGIQTFTVGNLGSADYTDTLQAMNDYTSGSDSEYPHITATSVISAHFNLSECRFISNGGNGNLHLSIVNQSAATGARYYQIYFSNQSDGIWTQCRVMDNGVTELYSNLTELVSYPASLNMTVKSSGIYFYADDVEVGHYTNSSSRWDFTHIWYLIADGGISFDSDSVVQTNVVLAAAGDTTAPTYSSLTSSTTIAGASCQFSSTWTDETGLATTGGYIFGTNNTGTFTNETWTAFSSNPQIISTTKTLNSTVGNKVQWCVWANDTSNNWNNTGLQTITLTDGTLPTFGSITGNTTAAGAAITYSCTISDNVAVSGFIASWNNTGSWANGTWTSGGAGTLSGTHNSTVGNKISVIFYANDTSNNWAASSTSTFTLTDGTAPTFGAISSNTTVANASASITCAVSDNVAVSGFIASWNNSGAWINGTWTSGSSGSLTGTLNSTVGIVVSAKFYANDTTNNWSSSSQYNFTLTADTYTVVLTPSSSSVVINQPVTVTIGISRTTGTTVSNYVLNITKDGTLYKENFTGSQFVETEMNPTGHVYNCTGLVDSDASASVTPTCTALTITWTVVGPGSSGEGNQSPSQSTITFQVDVLDLGVVQPNSTATATLHFTFSGSSFTLFSLTLDEPFQSWYSGGNFSTQTSYPVDATGQGEGNLLLTFTIPNAILQTYNGAVTVQAIDSMGTVHTSSAEITAEVTSNSPNWIRENIGIVILAASLVIASLVAITVFVRRRH